MRTCLFIIFQFAFTVLAKAQFLSLSQGYDAEMKNIDSFKNQLAYAKADPTRVDLMILLARAYFHLNKDDSLAYYSQQALALSQKINYTRGIIAARLWLGEFLQRRGNFSGSLQLALQNFREAEQTKDTLFIFWTTRRLAGAYSSMNNNEMVLHYTGKNMQLVNSGYFNKAKDSILQPRRLYGNER